MYILPQDPSPQTGWDTNDAVASGAALKAFHLHLRGSLRCWVWVCVRFPALSSAGHGPPAGKGKLLPAKHMDEDIVARL